MNVEYFIIEMIHKSNALRFWVYVWRLSLTCIIVQGSMSWSSGTLHDPIVVSEPRFDKGLIGSLCRKSS